MIPYTRVTLLAPDRRAEVVIPSDEAVGVQYPALLALLGLSEGADLPSIQLVRPDGTLVDPELDLVAQKVRDGEILRLIPDDEVPPPAEISDVAGALTQATDSHPWRWKASDRILGTGTLLLVVGLILARTWLQEGSGGLPHWSWPLPGLAVVVAGALVFRFAGPDDSRPRAALVREAGTLLTCCGAGVLLPALVHLARVSNDAAGAVTALIIMFLAIGVIAVGRRHEGCLFGAAVAVMLAGLHPLLSRVTDDGLLVVGAIGAGSLVLLGMLPWLSLLVSGASRLDDEALAGVLPPRRRVDLVVRRSHDALASAALACAAAVSWSATQLARADNPWARGLAAALVLALLLRSRAFPLRLEVLALWAAALPPALALTDLLPGPGVRTAVIAAAVLILASAGLYRPPAHNRVRLRHWGDRLEALAVVCTLPLICGMTGMFSRLLEVFE